MCNGACIANSTQCSGSCGAAGYQKCGSSCIPNSACCAPAASDPHYVDSARGTDAPDRGGSGACAYKTIGYALSHGTGKIEVALGTYSNEAWPLTLTGSQQLLCNPSGAGRATIKMAQSSNGPFVVQLSGKNQVHDCIINGNGNNVTCVDVASSGSSSSPQLLTNLDIGDCANSGVEVEANVTNVTVQNSTFHNIGHGIAWDGGNTGSQMLSNTLTNVTDSWGAYCLVDNPGVTGTNNIENNGGLECCCSATLPHVDCGE